MLWQIRNAFYNSYTSLPETVRFSNWFNKQRLQTKLDVHRAAIKLISSVHLDSTDVLTKSFLCCREVASDAAEDSSLSKFHTLFLYNKEKQNTSCLSIVY